MKKLVVGLIAVCAAFGVQAGYVDWSIQYKLNSSTDADTISAWGESGATGYTAYLLSAEQYNAITEFTGKSAFSSNLGSASLDFEKSQKSSRYYSTGAQQAEADASNYYIILANDSGYSVVASNVSASPYADASSGGTGLTPNLVKDSVTAVPSMTAYSGGSTDPTPEPTSGLLLLVGAGLLGLRRKQK